VVEKICGLVGFGDGRVTCACCDAVVVVCVVLLCWEEERDNDEDGEERGCLNGS